MFNDFFSGGFAGLPVLGIVSPTSVQGVVAECNAAWDGGVRLVEITMRGPLALDVLRAAVAAGRERGLPVGAGSVLNPQALEAVFAAGAAFAVSPGFDAGLVSHAGRRGMQFIPGVATPSDVQHAVNHGCRWLKAFPANVLTPTWFSALRGPFADAQFIATGGVTAASAQQFLDAGAAAVGVGAALRDVVAQLRPQ